MSLGARKAFQSARPAPHRDKSIGPGVRAEFLAVDRAARQDDGGSLLKNLRSTAIYRHFLPYEPQNRHDRGPT